MFGISIDSRYGKAHELAEMLNFTYEIAQENLEGAVRSIFYDSKADLCTFELNPDVEEHSDIAKHIFSAAEKTISQFELFGIVGHSYEVSEEMKEYEL